MSDRIEPLFHSEREAYRWANRLEWETEAGGLATSPDGQRWRLVRLAGVGRYAWGTDA